MTDVVASAMRAHPDYVRTSGSPQVARYEAQGWLIDNIIRANGPDWDQPRTIYLNVPCGPEANADFATIRERVKKIDDFAPAFEATARRREGKAKAAEDAQSLVSARENYFIASVNWGAAQWSHCENSEENIRLNQNKRNCYSAYAQLADHHIEAVWIEVNGHQIPGWFHLPANFTGGKLPTVIEIPGMDGFKELAVSLYGDRWLNRGFAVLAIDGPGQNEAPLFGSYVSMENWLAAGPSIVNWLLTRPEVDPEQIVVTGRSFGSFFGTIVAATEPRLKACAVMSTCLEPGHHTIFEEACPTFKRRFMWMSGYTDEARFDRFVRDLTWEGHVERIAAPYLCVAGASEELSPVSFAERMLKQMPGPRQLVVYQESRHSVGNVASCNLGPAPSTLTADWMVERLRGKPFANESWFVRSDGSIVKSAL